MELLEAEKELTHRSDEVASLRQKLPWVRLEKEYEFETADGKVSLTDLFKGHSQLVVYHFMFGPDYTIGWRKRSQNPKEPMLPVNPLSPIKQFLEKNYFF